MALSETSELQRGAQRFLRSAMRAPMLEAGAELVDMEVKIVVAVASGDPCFSVGIFVVRKGSRFWSAAFVQGDEMRRSAGMEGRQKGDGLRSVARELSELNALANPSPCTSPNAKTTSNRHGV